MKKSILFLQAFFLITVACVTQAAETTPHMIFVITNNTKNVYVKYTVINPRGTTYKGLLSHSINPIMGSDTAIIKLFDNDALPGTYMLHYRVVDGWKNTLYADDGVVTLQKNSKVIWAISDEGKELKVTVLDL
ncbi:MAG: hypothetical protein NXI01_10225 [Gammaproteobacteria bacterium]|nr:hypothetical protein [Gammaproteobacteria bacterium]